MAGRKARRGALAVAPYVPARQVASELALRSSLLVAGSGVLTSSPRTVQTGDLIVVKYSNDNADSGIPALPTAPGQTFTQQARNLTTTYSAAAIYTAVVAGNPGTLVVTETPTGAADARSMVVEVWAGAALDPTPAVNATQTVTSSGGFTGTLTSEATASQITWVAADYNAVAPGTPAYRSGAVQDGLDYVAGQYTGYYATQGAAAPGAQTFGLTTPAGSAKWTYLALEIPPAYVSPDKTGGSNRPVTATLPAAGLRYPLQVGSTPVTVTASRPAGGTSNYVSAFPDATNTGVPTGTTLTAYTGPSTITVAGTTIDSKTISGGLDIRANNVTISKCKFTGGSIWLVLNDNTATGLQITDCEFDGAMDAGNDSAVNGSNFTITRCNIHGTGDGIKAMSGVTIQDCYIHDLAIIGDSHNDGVQSLGTTGLTIRHNTIWMADGATSCIILSTGSASDMRNILIDNNLFRGGAFTVYGGYQSGSDDVSKVSNITISNNHFSTTLFPRCGGYGPITSADPPVVTSNNTYYDGPNAGQSI